jgi:hypothetical protein
MRTPAISHESPAPAPWFFALSLGDLHRFSVRRLVSEDPFRDSNSGPV